MLPKLAIASGSLSYVSNTVSSLVMTSRSRSIVPPGVANAVITIGAGFPILMHGGDAGLRAAIYGPAGWVPMLVVIALIMRALAPGRAHAKPRRRP